jgi:hypothetical protein
MFGGANAVVLVALELGHLQALLGAANATLRLTALQARLGELAAVTAPSDAAAAGTLAAAAAPQLHSAAHDLAEVCLGAPVIAPACLLCTCSLWSLCRCLLHSEHVKQCNISAMVQRGTPRIWYALTQGGMTGLPRVAAQKHGCMWHDLSRCSYACP